MTQFGYVADIVAVKADLQLLTADGLIKEWELPYEEILTRLSAAIFFLTPSDDAELENIWKWLGKHKMLRYRENTEKKLSQLAWRVEFNGQAKLPV